MNKIFNALNVLGEGAHAHYFSEGPKIPPIKINYQSGNEENPEPIRPDNSHMPEHKEPRHDDLSDRENVENLVYASQPDTRFPIAVLVLVSFLGLALLVLNLRLLEEIRFERQILTALSMNVEKLVNRMANLDKVVLDFKEQSLEQVVGLKSAVNELSDALTTRETAAVGLSHEIDGLASGLEQVNAVLQENKIDMTAVQDNSKKIESKLDELNSANQNLLAQVAEMKGILKPPVAGAEVK